MVTRLRGFSRAMRKKIDESLLAGFEFDCAE